MSIDAPAAGFAPYVGVDGVAVDLRAGVLCVTLDRPGSLNSLTEPMLAGVADVMEQAADDPRVQVVRLGGAGRGFSSGAGIGADDQPGAMFNDPTKIIDEANRAVRAIVALPRPVVAVVQGPAAGVGLSLALACDIVLASEKAFFLLAFTKIGLMPDGGASALVAANIGRARAMRMALLAERLPARDAFDCGLVSGVYAADDFDNEVAKVIRQLVDGPSVALDKTKAAVNAATLTELDGALERELAGQSTLIMAHDFREGVRAFQERRPANFTDA